MRLEVELHDGRIVESETDYSRAQVVGKLRAATALSAVFIRQDGVVLPVPMVHVAAIRAVHE